MSAKKPKPSIRGVNMLQKITREGSTCSGISPKIYLRGVNMCRNVSRIQPVKALSLLENIPDWRGQHAPEYPVFSESYDAFIVLLAEKRIYIFTYFHPIKPFSFDIQSSRQPTKNDSCPLPKASEGSALDNAWIERLWKSITYDYIH